MAQSVGDLYITMGVDMSGMVQELVQAEQVASGASAKIKDRLMTVGSSLADLRTQAKMVKESLAGAADFRIRGDAGLDKLHDQLAKVRATGQVADSTLDKLSLTFQENARGAHTYTQALDKIASSKTASDAVRQLALQLSNEAKEANFAAASLEKRQRVLDRMISSQGRTFRSLVKQTQPAAEAGGTVSQSAAASGAARLVSGQLSIRAGEKFLTGTLGLGSALQTIFPVVGALATLSLLGELADRAGQAYASLQKIREEPALIAQEFRQLNAPLRAENDTLDLTNAKLENEIAKLSGKPENGLLEALAEARVAADQLADSLDKDLGALSKLLSEHEVGFLKGLLGEARTSDLIKEFGGGASGFLATGFAGRVQSITGTAQEQLAAVKPGNTDAEKKAALDQKNTINAKARNDLEKAYGAELAKVNAELEKAQKLQAQRNATTPSTAGIILNQAAIPFLTPTIGSTIPNQTLRIQQLEGIRHQLILQQQAVGSRFQNETLQEKVTGLQHQKSAEDLTRPFVDKMRELNAQIEAVNSSLSAVGKTDTAQTLAKSWGATQEAIAKVNGDLAKHHQSLTLGQQLDILSAEDTLALAKADEQWRQRLDQTTDSITNRIASLKLMTDAIGKGAAATRQAAIEGQVIQTLGTKYQDPEFMRTHSADVEAVRRGAASQYDAQQAQKAAQNLDKLSDQIDLEKSLALVQERGAEAIRLQTLAYQLRQMAQDGATQAEIQAAFDLTNAQKGNQSSANLAKIDEQIGATKRLSAAQLQGAEAARQAQLQIKYEQMQRQGASPAEIGQTKSLDTLQHQQQVTAEALRTAMSYRDQLESVNEQIAAVEQLRAKWGDTRDLEISLKSLEEQRTQILSQQALAVGSARDGMAAFFREMATQAESSAQQVHDAFRSAFGGINDELSKLMTGQKTNWASFLQSLGQQISKMGLEGLETTLARKIEARIGGGSTAPGAQGRAASTAHGIGATLGKVLGLGSDTLKRDGNTAATAFFVTLAGANGIPQWSVRGSSTNSDLGITPGDLDQLENGGGGESTPIKSRTEETLANGARNLPGIAGQIASAGVQLFEGFLRNLHPGASDSSAATPSAPSGASSAPGSQSGDVLTRDPSGLIIRTPAPATPSADQSSLGNFDASGLAQSANAQGLALPQGGTDLIAELAPLASLLGVSGGSGKPDGSSAAPFFVKQVAADSGNLIQGLLNKFLGGGQAGAAGGSFLDALSGLFGGGGAAAAGDGLTEAVTSTISFGGAFAGGGKPPMGKISVVGEKGPELFIPDRPGTIIPNHKIAFGGFRATGGSVDPGMAYVVGERGKEAFASFGGAAPDHSSRQPAQNVYYTIDARGTDPVLTEQRTRAAIVAAHQSAIVTSVQTSSERARRQPQR